MENGQLNGNEKEQMNGTEESPVHEREACPSCGSAADETADAEARLEAMAEDAPELSRGEGQPSGSTPLVGVDIDEERIRHTNRLTPDYLKMLEEQQKEMETRGPFPGERNLPEAEAKASEKEEKEKARQALSLQIEHQKSIIEQNKHAWFGRKKRNRREAEQNLKELERLLAELG